jgi:hypothetical protein
MADLEEFVWKCKSREAQALDPNPVKRSRIACERFENIGQSKLLAVGELC